MRQEKQTQSKFFTFFNSNLGVFLLGLGVTLTVWVSSLILDYNKLRSERLQRIDSLKTEISIRVKYLTKIDKEHFQDEHELMDSVFYGIDKTGYLAKIFSVYPEKYAKRSLLSLSGELASLSEKDIDKGLKDALTEMPKALRGEIFSYNRNSTIIISSSGGRILYNNQPSSKENAFVLKSRIVAPIENWLVEYNRK